MAFFREGRHANSWVTLAVFAVLQPCCSMLIVNGSIGHLLLRMRVVPIARRLARRSGGRWCAPLLLCLAIPALIWDRDQRGLHDRLAGTVLVRV